MKKTLIAASTLAAVLAVVAPLDGAWARDADKDGVQSRHFVARNDKPRYDDHRHHDRDRDRYRHDGYRYDNHHSGHRHDRHDGRYGDHQCYRPRQEPSRWCGTGWCNQPYTIRPGLLWNGAFFFD